MILGIDPGLHGALALYDPKTNRIISAVTVPTFTIQRNGKSKGTVNLVGVMSLVADLAARVKHAFIELVGPMHKQGVSSTWSFARTDTTLECALVAARIPYSRVAPRVWQKAINVASDGDAARLRAGQLMPEDAHRWTPARLTLTKVDAEGIADAALIAYYGGKNFC